MVTPRAAPSSGHTSPHAQAPRQESLYRSPTAPSDSSGPAFPACCRKRKCPRAAHFRLGSGRRPREVSGCRRRRRRRRAGSGAVVAEVGGLGGGHARPREVGSSVGRSRPRPRSAARKAGRRRWRRRPPGAPSSRRPASRLEEVTLDSESAARWRAAGAARGGRPGGCAACQVGGSAGKVSEQTGREACRHRVTCASGCGLHGNACLPVLGFTAVAFGMCVFCCPAETLCVGVVTSRMEGEAVLAAQCCWKEERKACTDGGYLIQSPPWTSFVEIRALLKARGGGDKELRERTDLFHLFKKLYTEDMHGNSVMSEVRGTHVY